MNTNLTLFFKRISEATTEYKVFAPLCKIIEVQVKQFIQLLSDESQTLNKNKTIMRKHVEHGVQQMLGTNEELLNMFMKDANTFVEMNERYNTEIKKGDDKDQIKEYYNENNLNIIPRIKRIFKSCFEDKNLSEEGTVYLTGVVLSFYQHLLRETVPFTKVREEKMLKKREEANDTKESRKTTIIANDYNRVFKANKVLNEFMERLNSITLRNLDPPKEKKETKPKETKETKEVKETSEPKPKVKAQKTTTKATPPKVQPKVVEEVPKVKPKKVKA